MSERNAGEEPQLPDGPAPQLPQGQVVSPKELERFSAWWSKYNAHEVWVRETCMSLAVQENAKGSHE